MADLKMLWGVGSEESLFKFLFFCALNNKEVLISIEFSDENGFG